MLECVELEETACGLYPHGDNLMISFHSFKI